MKTILRQDSRDLIFNEHFSSVSQFPYESHFGDGVPLLVEKPGEVDCTALSIIKVAYSQTKNDYDVNDLWINTKKTPQGADPRDTIGASIRRGLLNLATKVFDFPFFSYFRADIGSNADAFDNARSAMVLAKSSLMVNSNWYQNWENCLAGETMVTGDVVITAHSYVVLDWQGDDFLIDSHQGYVTRMPRAVFNAEMSKWGVSSDMLMNKIVSDMRTKTKMEMIIDACKNAILLLRQLIILKDKQKDMIKDTQAPVKDTTPVFPSVPLTPAVPMKIYKWAIAIKTAEGWTPGSPSQIHNNPGNLGYTTLTASWGAMQGGAKSDGGHFCLFPNYITGFKALCNFLTLGAEDELRAFHQARTLVQFSSVYGNTGAGYGESIAKILGVSPDTDISTFLS